MQVFLNITKHVSQVKSNSFHNTHCFKAAVQKIMKLVFIIS